MRTTRLSVSKVALGNPAAAKAFSICAASTGQSISGTRIEIAGASLLTASETHAVMPSFSTSRTSASTATVPCVTRTVRAA